MSDYYKQQNALNFRRLFLCVVFLPVFSCLYFFEISICLKHLVRAFFPNCRHHAPRASKHHRNDFYFMSKRLKEELNGFNKF